MLLKHFDALICRDAEFASKGNSRILLLNLSKVDSSISTGQRKMQFDTSKSVTGRLLFGSSLKHVLAAALGFCVGSGPKKQPIILILLSGIIKEIPLF
jgi:hypothetical protein